MRRKGKMYNLVKQFKASNLLDSLGSNSKYDVTGIPKMLTRKHPAFIAPMIGKEGKRIPIFRVLQSNYCINNCAYCINRRDRDYKRMRFEPEMLAKTFMSYAKKGKVKGLFLSSGIYPTADIAQERMLASIEILRNEYKYDGLIHAVMLPGADPSFIPSFAQYCDRISLNLEVPDQRYIEKLAPEKDFQRDLWRGLSNITGHPDKTRLSLGVTTQFVVGATDETDEEILSLVSELYNDQKVTRVFYSGFEPVENTVLENHTPCHQMREVRLYQADLLLRKYGFNVQEFVFDKNGNLPLEADPKTVWAKNNMGMFPIDVLLADYEQLIRTPGVGIQTAKKILVERKHIHVRTVNDIKKLGIVIQKALRFITVGGKTLTTKSTIIPKSSQQMLLWDEI